MSTQLYMAGDRIFASLSNLEKQKADLTDEALLAEFGQKKVTIILLDPPFVSEVSSVLLERRSDRHKMATAKFEALAGDVGFGSWCIALHLGETRLFAWAIDSDSLEAMRLRRMIDSGVLIEKISSQTLLLPLPVTPKKVETFLRVHCTEQSTQLALMLDGQWIFTRRVDLSSSSPLEAVQSSLVHLKSQFYLDDSTSLCWQLLASDKTKEEMSVLWLGEGAHFQAPCPSTELSESSLSLDYFNSIAELRQSRVTKFISLIRSGASVVILLLLTYLMPAVLLSTEAPRRFNEIEPETESALMSLRFWQMNILESETIHLMDDVSEFLQKILSLTTHEDELELISLSIDSLQSINLRFQLKEEISNPVARLHLQTRLKNRLETLIPTHQITSFKGNQLAVGQALKKSSFEIILEVRDDED